MKFTKAYLTVCIKHHRLRGINSQRATQTASASLKAASKRRALPGGRRQAATHKKGIAANGRLLWQEVPSVCHTAEETVQHPVTVESLLSPITPAKHEQPVRHRMVRERRARPPIMVRGRY
jgi:hypothetical protein